MEIKINPIIEKEMKIKTRGWKFPALITAYTAFLVFMVFLFFALNYSFSVKVFSEFDPTVAVAAFNMVSVTQMGLILLITPLLTSTSISSEREKQTFDLLLCTDIKYVSIILGKINSAILHVIILVIASLPVMASVFLYGGIPVSDLITIFFYYILSAFTVASVGIFFSSIFRRSLFSIIFTYVSLGIILIWPFIYTALKQAYFFSINSAEHQSNSVFMLLITNTLFGFYSILEPNQSLEAIKYFYKNADKITIPFWSIPVILNIILSSILIIISSLLINPIRVKIKDRIKNLIFFRNRRKENS